MAIKKKHLKKINKKKVWQLLLKWLKHEHSIIWYIWLTLGNPQNVQKYTSIAVRVTLMFKKVKETSA